MSVDSPFRGGTDLYRTNEREISLEEKERETDSKPVILAVQRKRKRDIFSVSASQLGVIGV